MTVSISIITYNHEKYICAAIQSILMQETNFEFELIIANDCSTDDSDNIIQECIKNNKAKGKNIKYYKHEKNMGMIPNLIFSLKQCTGKYIAICEGDDYWTDPQKLQKQVDFLDAHPQVSLCAHNHFYLKNKLKKANKGIKEKIKFLSIEDYLLNPFFQTASMMLRGEYLVNELPDWYTAVLAGDNFLVLLMAMHGKIAFLNQTMSVYRIHLQSITHKRNLKKVGENYIHHLQIFNIYSNRKYENTINIVIRKWLCNFSYMETTYFTKLLFFFKNFIFMLKHYTFKHICYLSYKYISPYTREVNFD